MDNSNSISRQVTKKVKISLVAAGPEVDLKTPVWAINWFNLKRKWVYDLYTRLAGPYAYKVGGRAYFKGRQIKRLAGSESDGREMLLIVAYPSAAHFLDLVSMGIFQLLSILRIMAVRDFVFGFTKRLDTEAMPSGIRRKYTGNKLYLVHHFRMEKDFSGRLSAIKKLASSKGIELFFAGTKAAHLEQETAEGKVRKAPFIMDGILVFEGENSDKLEKFQSDDLYREFMAEMESVYLALFGREI